MNFPQTAVEGPSTGVLDGVPIGIITCTPSGLIRSMNLAARRLLAARDGLWADGWLRSSARALGRGLADAGRGVIAALVVERPSGRLGYQLRIAPMTQRQVVVYVTDPAAMPAPHWSVLVEAYGMTPSEAAIAAALADGHDLRQISEARGVGVETCRKQLRAIFDKVGVRRQVDLIRVLSGGAVACGPLRCG